MLWLGQKRCSNVKLVNKVQWLLSILPLAWLNFCFTGFHLPNAFVLWNILTGVHSHALRCPVWQIWKGWDTVPVADPNTIDYRHRSDCSGPLEWIHCQITEFCLHEIPAFGWVKSDTLRQVIFLSFSPTTRSYIPTGLLIFSVSLVMKVIVSILIETLMNQCLFLEQNVYSSFSDS